MLAQILPSRAALVERIALQFEYGQNLINLVGQAGLGKSYLLESFITDKYPDFNKAFVHVSASMSDNELMHALLEHSFRAPLVDHTRSLSENFYALQRGQGHGPCLWVLDGGRHLSEEMVAELNKLAKQSPETLYILIASQSAGTVQGALDIHLEPLSARESQMLMSWYFKDLPMAEDPIYQAFLASAQGNPALLLAWQAEQHSTELRPKTTVKWHWHLLIGAALMGAIAIGLLYQKELKSFIPGNTNPVAVPSPQSADDNQSPVSEAPPTVTAPDWLKQDPANTPEQTAKVEVTDSAAVEQTDTTQPAQHPSTTLNNMRNDVQSIAAALEGRSDALSSAPAISNDSSQQAKAETTQQVAASDAAPETSSALITEALEQTPPSMPVTESGPDSLDDAKWFMALATSHWTIQLMAVTDEKDARALIAAYPALALKVYRRQRNSTQWWVVTYGDFATLATAKAALPQLPQEIKQNQPFYKKVQQIQEEITATAR
ncbi:SPOR domain-containing protein [Pseudoalteromonas fenneropenaei]|uniref:SPOR domain-containing protein n=1 Tax=Pseudoalteromonas fenneropenaei TaxID=1737459 RepID=A0ABV7CN78_9GAMM